MKKRIVFGILCIVWMLVIFQFSAATAQISNQSSDSVISFLQMILPIERAEWFTFLIRKTAHFSEYAILGALYYMFLHSFAISKRYLACISILMVSAYACTDELHQFFVAGRSAQLSDVFLDTLGGCFGVFVIMVFYGCWKHNKKAFPVDK